MERRRRRFTTPAKAWRSSPLRSTATHWVTTVFCAGTRVGQRTHGTARHDDNSQAGRAPRHSPSGAMASRVAGWQAGAAYLLGRGHACAGGEHARGERGVLSGAGGSLRGACRGRVDLRVPKCGGGHSHHRRKYTRGVPISPSGSCLELRRRHGCSRQGFAAGGRARPREACDDQNAQNRHHQAPAVPSSMARPTQAAGGRVLEQLSLAPRQDVRRPAFLPLPPVPPSPPSLPADLVARRARQQDSACRARGTAWPAAATAAKDTRRASHLTAAARRLFMRSTTRALRSCTAASSRERRATEESIPLWKPVRRPDRSAMAPRAQWLGRGRRRTASRAGRSAHGTSDPPIQLAAELGRTSERVSRARLSCACTAIEQRTGRSSRPGMEQQPATAIFRRASRPAHEAFDLATFKKVRSLAGREGPARGGGAQQAFAGNEGDDEVTAPCSGCGLQASPKRCALRPGVCPLVAWRRKAPQRRRRRSPRAEMA